MKKIIMVICFILFVQICKSQTKDSIRYFYVTYQYKDTIITKTHKITDYGSKDEEYYISGDGCIGFEIDAGQPFINREKLWKLIYKIHPDLPTTSIFFVTYIYEFKNKEEYIYYQAN